MTTIIDFECGNTQAIVNVYRRLHKPISLAKTVSELEGAKQLILPGVGSFDQVMDKFNTSGLRDKVTEMVFEYKTPILGICVGMQILAEASDEGQLKGLGWVPGQVKSFKNNPKLNSLPLPHMGWNDVTSKEGCPLFKSIENEARFYFLHSYYFQCENSENSISEVNYGADFTCGVSRAHIYGVQFHPEKSHHFGTTLLKNFAEL
jgi:glutamine amidotransferase